MDIKKGEWDASYVRHENHILYPKEEVVKFLNRFVRKKLGTEDFIDILSRQKLTALDYGCGIGRITHLLHEFGIDGYGLDISEVAIEQAENLFPSIKDKFQKVEGNSIPFKDGFFNITLSESVLDSMEFELASQIVNEIDRVTTDYFFASFISGDDSSRFREYSGEEIVETQHERGTIQSYFNWSKIINLFDGTSFKIEWARLITEESLLDRYKYGRYFVVCKKA